MNPGRGGRDSHGQRRGARDSRGPYVWRTHTGAELDRLDVVHPGEHTYDLRGGYRALSLRRLLCDLKPL